MPVTYVSSHHSADDPGGLIREALDLGAEFQGPAEDLVLAWIMRLEAGRDPAAAAKRLLAAYGLENRPEPAGAAGRVVQLLRETAASPCHLLAGGRRRGGRHRSEQG
jgi:hypothetical protein